MIPQRILAYGIPLADVLHGRNAQLRAHTASVPTALLTPEQNDSGGDDADYHFDEPLEEVWLEAPTPSSVAGRDTESEHEEDIGSDDFAVDDIRWQELYGEDRFRKPRSRTAPPEHVYEGLRRGEEPEGELEDQQYQCLAPSTPNPIHAGRHQSQFKDSPRLPTVRDKGDVSRPRASSAPPRRVITNPPCQAQSAVRCDGQRGDLGTWTHYCRACRLAYSPVPIQGRNDPCPLGCVWRMWHATCCSG